MRSRPSPSYTVWAADQNANTLYVLDPDGKVLKRSMAPRWVTPNGHICSGVYPRMSMSIVPTRSLILSPCWGTKTVAVKAIIASVGKSPHAAQPNPQHPDRIYVSNIAPQAVGADGKPDRGETITELVRTGGPKWEIARFLDLKGAGPGGRQPLPEPSPGLCWFLQGWSLYAGNAL